LHATYPPAVRSGVAAAENPSRVGNQEEAAAEILWCFSLSVVSQGKKR
jgi:hypothetical protein